MRADADARGAEALRRDVNRRGGSAALRGLASAFAALVLLTPALLHAKPHSAPAPRVEESAAQAKPSGAAAKPAARTAKVLDRKAPKVAKPAQKKPAASPAKPIAKLKETAKSKSAAAPAAPDNGAPARLPTQSAAAKDSAPSAPQKLTQTPENAGGESAGKDVSGVAAKAPRGKQEASKNAGGKKAAPQIASPGQAPSAAEAPSVLIPAKLTAATPGPDAASAPATDEKGEDKAPTAAAAKDKAKSSSKSSTKENKKEKLTPAAKAAKRAVTKMATKRKAAARKAAETKAARRTAALRKAAAKRNIKPPRILEGELTALRKRAGNNLVKTSVQGFSFYLPGDLMPGTSPTGGDVGAPDDRFHRPAIRFPIEKGPAYVNSQVWGWGGTFGLGSSECDLRNYSYPWRDNFCEARSWVSGACPGGIGHQGVDIRAKTCDDDKYWAVAAEAGRITEVGVYGITLKGVSGYEYTYLHINTPKAKVRPGQKVKIGQRLALISNHYGGTPTSIHLHFEMRRPNPKGGEPVLVSPYASLVPAYLRLMSGSKEKAVEALKTATILPRPKQPPKFRGFSGNGPRGWGGGLRECSACPLMKRVPGGKTKIGSPNSESGRDRDEGPRRSVTVSSFVMSRNEVTRRSWRACVKDGYCRPAQKGMTWKSLNHPITGVSLRDITGVGVGKKGFLAWLNNKAKRRGRKVRYRLPSEAEWEHALRAGGTDPYSTGKTPDPRRIAFSAGNYQNVPERIRKRKSPVTRRSLRANRWGFYEMAGNVWEIVADCWARDHRFTPRDGSSRGTNCSLGTMKGGSVFTSGRDVRSATRSPIGASVARRDVGFRVVREKIGAAKKSTSRSASKASVNRAAKSKKKVASKRKSNSKPQKQAAKSSSKKGGPNNRSSRFEKRFKDD